MPRARRGEATCDGALAHGLHGNFHRGQSDSKPTTERKDLRKQRRKQEEQRKKQIRRDEQQRPERREEQQRPERHEEREKRDATKAPDQMPNPDS